MKRFLKFVCISIIIVLSAFTLVKLSDKYKVSTLEKNVDWSIDSKSCRDAVDFDKDENGNTYVAFKNEIKVLKGEGKEENIIKDDSLDIESIMLYENKIYYISGESLYVYDLASGAGKILVSGIPSKGQYLDRKLLVKDSKILLAVGSATNSGVAEPTENTADKEIPYDLSPINIILSGNNYGEKSTGGFLPYGNSALKGQKIQCSKIGNGSIVEIDPSTGETVLYACGLRNITGWGIDSEDNLICAVGGMLDEGSRPVKRDSDYIYKVEKNKWYGWPDFSGGDPITSSRFKGEKPVTRIIENPPNKIVSGPAYQFDKVNSIKYLSVDKDGAVLEKDAAIYYDSDSKTISSISKKYSVANLLQLKEESSINQIRIKTDGVYILDSEVGCVYKLSIDKNSLAFHLPNVVIIFIIVLAGVLIFITMYKYGKKQAKEK